MRITRTSKEKVRRLAELGLLRGCTNTELAAAAALTCEYDAPAGRVLCREGTPGNECFVVVEGEVVVSIGGTEIAAWPVLPTVSVRPEHVPPAKSPAITSQ